MIRAQLCFAHKLASSYEIDRLSGGVATITGTCVTIFVQSHSTSVTSLGYDFLVVLIAAKYRHCFDLSQ